MKSIWFLAALALTVLELCLLLSFFEPAISHDDANGYFSQARVIAETGRTTRVRESPLEYLEFHWVDLGNGRYANQYPPGLPLILALLSENVGLTAALLLNPILLSLALFGLFLLCREHVGDAWAVVSMLVMITNPIASIYAQTGDAHAAVVFFVVWGAYFYSKWGQSFSTIFGFLGGLMFGILPSIHYGEAVYGLGVLPYVALHLCNQPAFWRSILAMAAGALAPIVCLSIHNAKVFGSFWETGYSLAPEPNVFSLENFAANVGPYLRDSLLVGSGPLLVLGIIGIFVWVAQPDRRKYGVLFAGLTFPITILYMAFSYTQPGAPPQASLRYLVPTFYLYTVPGLYVLKQLYRQHHRAVRIGAGGVVTVIVLWTLWGVPQLLFFLKTFEGFHAEMVNVAKIIDARVPDGAVLIADRQIQINLDITGRWKLIDAEQLLSQNISKSENYQAVLADLDRWSASRNDIYWLGEDEVIRSFVPSSDAVSAAAELEFRPMERVAADIVASLDIARTSIFRSFTSEIASSLAHAKARKLVLLRWERGRQDR